MSTARYLRTILIGDIVSGTFAGEIWTTGISGVIGDAGGVWAGEINAALPQFDVGIVGDSETDGGFQIDWAWEGSQVLDKASQKVLAASAVTFWNAIKTMTPSACRMTGVRVNAYDAQNKVIGGANMFDLVTPLPGSASTYGPAQLAVCASLRTGRRGPAGRGRMYLPLFGATQQNGALSSANQNTIATATKDLIEDLAGESVTSAVVNPAPLTYSSVDKVQVGNLFDIQRRRTNAINESYVTQTPTYPQP